MVNSTTALLLTKEEKWCRILAVEQDDFSFAGLIGAAKGEHIGGVHTPLALFV
jgi:hypothetical protein